jgi:hypothetical protein
MVAGMITAAAPLATSSGALRPLGLLATREIHREIRRKDRKEDPKVELGRAVP